jgi:predicted small integral membrane protein
MSGISKIGSLECILYVWESDCSIFQKTIVLVMSAYYAWIRVNPGAHSVKTVASWRPSCG